MSPVYQKKKKEASIIPWYIPPLFFSFLRRPAALMCQSVSSVPSREIMSQ